MGASRINFKKKYQVPELFDIGSKYECNNQIGGVNNHKNGIKILASSVRKVSLGLSF